MSNVTKEAALEYHREGKPGKIEVVPTKPYSTQHDLALAYSPGVAYPCKEIEAHQSNKKFKFAEMFIRRGAATVSPSSFSCHGI